MLARSKVPVLQGNQRGRTKFSSYKACKVLGLNPRDKFMSPCFEATTKWKGYQRLTSNTTCHTGTSLSDQRPRFKQVHKRVPTLAPRAERKSPYCSEVPGLQLNERVPTWAPCFPGTSVLQQSPRFTWIQSCTNVGPVFGEKYRGSKKKPSLNIFSLQSTNVIIESRCYFCSRVALEGGSYNKVRMS